MCFFSTPLRCRHAPLRCRHAPLRCRHGPLRCRHGPLRRADVPKKNTNGCFFEGTGFGGTEIPLYLCKEERTTIF